MDKKTKDLLESVLSDEQKAVFKEQMKAKIAEAKESAKAEVEEEVRKEMSERYEQSIAHLTEALNLALTDAVEKYASQTGVEMKRLKEERKQLTQAIKETRSEYKNKLVENTKAIEIAVVNKLKESMISMKREKDELTEQKVAYATKSAKLKEVYSKKITESMSELEKLVTANLKKEITETRAERKSYKQAKKDVAVKLSESRLALKKQTADRINQLEAFVIENLKKELSEFNEDKKELAERRAVLERDAKSKLEEARTAFIKRASKLVEAKVDSALRNQMTKLKEDIQIAKENMLGQKIFETFQSEFMGTALSNGSMIKKLQKTLESTKSELSEARSLVDQQSALIESVERKAKLKENQATRLNKINTLLRPLSQEKREIMENLLESVKTDKLEESYKKYLPTVLGEAKTVKNQPRKTLTEGKKINKITEVTGNRPPKLVEEDDNDSLKAELIRLAGLNK